MARTFVYARVSTTDQTPENQVREIEAAGFKVAPSRVIAETVSGGVQAARRPGFARLLDKLEDGDVLVVTKLDRLGRNVIDVRQTVEHLAERGVRVHCLALGGVDLTSPAGKMTMGVLAAVAEFERDLLRERTAAGIERARAEGKQPGRPSRLTDEQRTAIRSRIAAGATIYALAKEYGVDRRLIHRARDAASER
ncbi:recombinase family protein [Methylocystis echinoides]|uniref:recombinase family protein n=1 Tax=Methylocystis echinoides TaxID=29468 RepID=UPI003437E533